MVLTGFLHTGARVSTLLVTWAVVQVTHRLGEDTAFEGANGAIQQRIVYNETPLCCSSVNL